MRSPLLGLFALTLLISAPAAGCSARATDDSAKTEALKIVSASGQHRFSVEIADDPAERERGLMYRKSMGDTEGMLFEWPEEDQRAFWMHNTYIPLDILFIDGSGKIVSIARNAAPMDETPLPSYAPAKGVLEINGGLAAKLGVKPGDQIIHPFFAKP